MKTHRRMSPVSFLRIGSISLLACFSFVLVTQRESLAQWKQGAGFSNANANNNIDQVSGFITWGNYILADAKTPNTDPGATTDSLFLSTDNGVTWSSFAPNGRLPLVAVNTGGQIPALVGLINISGTVFGNDIVGYSTDGGQTWSADTTAWPLPTGVPICLIAVGSTVYAGCAEAVFQQASPGAPWTPDTIGLGIAGFTFPVTNLIQTSAGLLASAGFNAGNFISTDGGKSWMPANSGLPSVNGNQWLPIWGFAVAGSSVYAMVAHDSTDATMDFYRSMDGGHTWTHMNNTPLYVTNVLPAIAATGKDVFVSGDSGFFYSNDYGATWHEDNKGLDMGENTNPAVQISGPNVILSQEDGAWYRPLTDFSSSSVTENPPASLDLSVSENPVTIPEVTIAYTLSQAAPVRLEVMDELGREVRMLQNGRSYAGTSTIALDVNDLSPGTYFVRVEANGASAMQKLVIAH